MFIKDDVLIYLELAAKAVAEDNTNNKDYKMELDKFSETEQTFFLCKLEHYKSIQKTIKENKNKSTEVN